MDFIAPPKIESRPENALKNGAFLAKALADENRLRILLFIGDGKKSVTQITEAMGLSQPLVSHHLKELKRSLLVTVERKGPFVFYELSRPDVLSVIADLEHLADALLTARHGF